MNCTVIGTRATCGATLGYILGEPEKYDRSLEASGTDCHQKLGIVFHSDGICNELDADTAEGRWTAAERFRTDLEWSASLAQSLTKPTTKPYLHLSFGWPPEEATLPEETKEALVREYLNRMGYGGCDWVAVEHVGRTPHVHVCLCRIDQETRLAVSSSNSKMKALAVGREITREHGLRSRSEINVGHRPETPSPSMRAAVADTVREAVRVSVSLEQMADVLAEKGVRMEVISHKETGEAYGVRFTAMPPNFGKEWPFKGSDLGRDLTFKMIKLNLGHNRETLEREAGCLPSGVYAGRDRRQIPAIRRVQASDGNPGYTEYACHRLVPSEYGNWWGTVPAYLSRYEDGHVEFRYNENELEKRVNFPAQTMTGRMLADRTVRGRLEGAFRQASANAGKTAVSLLSIFISPHGGGGGSNGKGQGKKKDDISDEQYENGINGESMHI